MEPKTEKEWMVDYALEELAIAALREKIMALECKIQEHHKNMAQDRVCIAQLRASSAE